MPEGEWTRCCDRLPPEGVVVDTKIDDKRGVRNEQQLTRKGGLMFFPDYSMYVYYSLTHWRTSEREVMPDAR